VIKADLVAKVRERVRLGPPDRGPQGYLFPEMAYPPMSRKRAAEMVDSLLGIMKNALARGEDVKIRGFGTFRVAFRWARKGRHPRTGELMILRSRRVVRFRCSPKLRRMLDTPPKETP